MKYRGSFTIIFIILIHFTALSQKEIVMSQYMYNKYSINPGFGGSHDVLSVFGSYRKQWVGFEDSPSGAIFTAHSPLKNEKVALGTQLFNDSYAVTHNTGISFSYTYKLLLSHENRLAFGVSAGIVNYSSNWNDVIYTDVTEDYDIDPMFNSAESSSSPILGFGTALYNSKYFVGLSVPTFIYFDRYVTGESSVDFAKIDYLLTAGYLYDISNKVSIQPSALLRINMDDETFVDVSATAVFLKSLLVGASYRTVGDLVAILGYQISPQLRFTYSLDYSLDKIATYNNGTHEVSLQFDFGYKIHSPNPKFF